MALGVHLQNEYVGVRSRGGTTASLEPEGEGTTEAADLEGEDGGVGSRGTLLPIDER